MESHSSQGSLHAPLGRISNSPSGTIAVDVQNTTLLGIYSQRTVYPTDQAEVADDGLKRKEACIERRSGPYISSKVEVSAQDSSCTSRATTSGQATPSRARVLKPSTTLFQPDMAISLSRKREASARILQYRDLPEDAPRLSKQLTGKYNFLVMKQIAATEDLALAELVQLYQVEDEDHLPVSFDIHALVDMTETDRRTFLVEMLEGCPAAEGAAAFMDKYLDTIKDLTPDLQ